MISPVLESKLSDFVNQFVRINSTGINQEPPSPAMSLATHREMIRSVVGISSCNEDK